MIKAFGSMKEPVIQRYAIQIVQGLQALHENGLYHGFLNAESVNVDHSGHVTLSDFFVGRRLYLEDASDRYGRKTDIQCLGVLVMQMAQGSVRDNVCDTSDALSSFINLCLQKNPALRPDASTLLEHEFLKAEPEDTNQMLSDVCSSLDVTMQRLHQEIPSKSNNFRRKRPFSSRRIRQKS